jgi:hypothetical protein
MTTTRIKQLALDLSSGNFLKSEELFGGANLIIQTKESKSEYLNHHLRYPQDVLVFTDYAFELSWLVFKLQEILANNYPNSNQIDYIAIGEIINLGLKKNWNIISIMLNVIIFCLED